MRLKITLLFLVLAGAFSYYVIKGDYFTSKNEGSSSAPAAPNQAPSSKKDITPETLLSTLYSADLRDYEGNKFNIPKGSLDGKDVVFHFWASWCAPCVN